MVVGGVVGTSGGERGISGDLPGIGPAPLVIDPGRKVDRFGEHPLGRSRVGGHSREAEDVRRSGGDRLVSVLACRLEG